jgi:hypothetical protein
MEKVEDILTTINPSKKVLIWIISILCGLLLSSGVLIYDKIIKPKDNTEVINLQLKQFELENEIKTLNKDKSEAENKTKESIKVLKTYVDKRLDYIVKNFDEKNRKTILNVLDLSKSNILNIKMKTLFPDDSTMKNIEEKFNKTIDQKLDSLKINKCDTITDEKD